MPRTDVEEDKSFKEGQTLQPQIQVVTMEEVIMSRLASIEEDLKKLSKLEDLDNKLNQILLLAKQ